MAANPQKVFKINNATNHDVLRNEIKHACGERPTSAEVKIIIIGNASADALKGLPETLTVLYFDKSFALNDKFFKVLKVKTNIDTFCFTEHLSKTSIDNLKGKLPVIHEKDSKLTFIAVEADESKKDRILQSFNNVLNEYYGNKVEKILFDRDKVKLKSMEKVQLGQELRDVKRQWQQEQQNNRQLRQELKQVMDERDAAAANLGKMQDQQGQLDEMKKEWKALKKRVKSLEKTQAAAEVQELKAKLQETEKRLQEAGIKLQGTEDALRCFGEGKSMIANLLVELSQEIEVSFQETNDCSSSQPENHMNGYRKSGHYILTSFKDKESCNFFKPYDNKSSGSLNSGMNQNQGVLGESSKRCKQP